MLNFFLMLANRGLMLGLTLGVLCLLRPVLLRVFSPQQRAFLWGIFWYFGLCAWHGWVAFFPVTFQDMIIPRTAYLGSEPALLPPEYFGEGTYNLALPGAGLVPVTLTDALLWMLVCVWLAGAVGLVLCFFLQKRRMLRGVQRTKMEGDDPRRKDLPALENQDVWLCKGLPTSFVASAVIGNPVYLQEELPPQRLELVLRHEAEHIGLRHCYWKCLATGVLVLYWWNPLIWLSFRFFCQDLELACDASVLKELEPERRREYAKTLLELGTGRQLWAIPLSFGECDGAARVRAVALWKPRKLWKTVLTTLLAVLLFLFFFGGHYKLAPVSDMLLAWERDQGSTAYFKQELGREMARELDLIPEQRFIEVKEIWEGEAQTGEHPRSALWVEAADGSWYHVYYYWMGNTESVWVLDVERVSTPNLSGLDRLI